MRISPSQWKTAGVLTAMIAAFALVIWLPDQLNASHLQERVAQAQVEIAAGDEARAELPNLRLELASLRDEASATTQYVPAKPELAELMRELSAALQRHGAADIHTRHGNEFMGADYNVIPITLQFSSSFIDAFLFVEHIESMRRLVRLDKVDLVGDRESPRSLLKVTVELSAFYAPHVQEKN